MGYLYVLDGGYAEISDMNMARRSPVRLLRWQETAIAFYIGLGHGQAQVALLARAVEGLHARVVLSTDIFIQMVGNQVEGEERVGADFLD